MNKKLLILLSILLLLVFNTSFTFGNNEPKERTLICSGKILDVNHNELLAGVTITATNCEKTVYSDLNGNFFIYIKVKSDENFKLEFSQVGYSTKTLTIADLKGSTSNLLVNLIEE